MPVKYHCAKCGRRFVDWGAEKLGFKCPDCEDEELVRAGGAEERPAKKPSLKRGAKRAVPVAPVEHEEEFYEADAPVGGDDEEEVVGDVDEDEEETYVPVEEEDGASLLRGPAELITTETDEDEVDIDMPEELSFGDVAPSLPEDTFEESEEDFG